MAAIDKEMKNESASLGNCKYCLDGYLNPSFDGLSADEEIFGNKEKIFKEMGSIKTKKVFKGIEMTAMDDIPFGVDINLIEEETS